MVRMEMPVTVDPDPSRSRVASPARRAVLRGLAVAPLAALTVRKANAQARSSRPVQDDADFVVATLGPRRPAEFDTERARRAFERELARPVRMQHFTSGARLADAASAGNLHCAVHTSLTFAATALACRCALPVLRPISLDGAAGVRAVVLVRQDSGFARIGDLAGRVALGAKRGTVAGEVARSALSARFGPAAAPFHDDAGDPIARFDAGEGDALVGFERIDAKGQALDGTTAFLKADVRVVWRSFPVWHGPVALSASGTVTRVMGEKAVAALATMRPGGPELRGMGLGRVRNLTAASFDEYAPLLRVVRGS